MHSSVLPKTWQLVLKMCIINELTPAKNHKDKTDNITLWLHR